MCRTLTLILKQGACSFPGENARSWEALGEARPGQSTLSAGALRYRAWAQSWSSAALAARSVLPSNRPASQTISHGVFRAPRVCHTGLVAMGEGEHHGEVEEKQKGKK